MTNEMAFADQSLSTPWLGSYGLDEFYDAEQPARKFEDDLYFIAMNDACKIGRSQSPLSRLTQIQGATPYDLKLLVVLPRMGWQEKIWHMAFGMWRMRREWFEGAAVKDAMWAAHRGEQWIPHVPTPDRVDDERYAYLDRIADREEFLFNQVLAGAAQ